MSELQEALRIAQSVINSPTNGRTTRMAIISRQLLESKNIISYLQDELDKTRDPGLDLIHANVQSILDVNQKAIRKLKVILKSCGRIALSQRSIEVALRVIEAAETYHPMYTEDWTGWPDES